MKTKELVVSAIENGKAEDVKVGTLKALAEALETNIGDFFFTQAV